MARLSLSRRFGQLVQGVPNLIAAALVLYLPLVPGIGAAPIDAAALVLTYAILGTGMRVVVVSAGLLDLGYAAYFGIGAYATALLSRDTALNVWGAVPVSGALAGGISALLGGPMARSGRARFALATLAFGILIQGLFASFGGEIALPESARAEMVYDVIAAVWLAAALILWIVRRSALGLAWIAVRDDEAVASSLGFDPVAIARSAYVTGAAVAGVAGALLAVQQGAVRPDDFTFAATATVLVIVLTGGSIGQAGILAAAIVFMGARLWWPGIAADGAVVALAAVAAVLIMRPKFFGARSAKAFASEIGAHP